MGIGVASIQTSQKKEQAGPPFASNSADNGLSVDPISSRIVLGNNVGAVGAPAQLLSDREVVTEDALLNLFAVILNSIVTGINTRLDGQSVVVTGANFTSPSVQVIAADFAAASAQIAAGIGSTAVLSVAAGGGGGNASVSITTDQDVLTITPTGAGRVSFIIQAVLDVWQINTATGNSQVTNGSMVTDNGATWQITGTATYRYFQQGQGAGAYNIDRDLDSGKLFTNSAAATFNIFNSVGANFRGGFIFRLNIANVAGGTIQAQAGETIAFGALATTAGGTIFSITVGSSIVLVLTTNGWVTESFTGTWVLT